MNQELEPKLMYGIAWFRDLKRIHNLRITYPNKDILSIDDDAKSAFSHLKYHPDFVSVFILIVFSRLYTPTGGYISSAISPANFESFPRARNFIANKLSRNKEFVKKNIKASSSKFNLVKEYTKIRFLLMHQKMNITKDSKLKKVKLFTKFSMFVDDSIFADIDDYIKMVMATSIEAICLLFG